VYYTEKWLADENSFKLFSNFSMKIRFIYIINFDDNCSKCTDIKIIFKLKLQLFIVLNSSKSSIMSITSLSNEHRLIIHDVTPSMSWVVVTSTSLSSSTSTPSSIISSFLILLLFLPYIRPFRQNLYQP